MKNTYLLLIAIFMTSISSCIVTDDDIDLSSNEIIEVEFDLPSISGIELNTNANVFFRQGPVQKIEVHAKESVIDQISDNVSNEVWDIDLTHFIWNRASIDIFITLPSLSTIKNNSSGNIYTTSIFKNLEEVTIRLGGSGNIDLELEANNIRSRLSGSGDINLYGNSPHHNSYLSGSGTLDALNLNSLDTYINLSGSGDAFLLVEEKLYGELNGSGNIYYQGNPNVDDEIYGTGDLIQYK